MDNIKIDNTEIKQIIKKYNNFDDNNQRISYLDNVLKFIIKEKYKMIENKFKEFFDEDTNIQILYIKNICEHSSPILFSIYTGLCLCKRTNFTMQFLYESLKIKFYFCGDGKSLYVSFNSDDGFYINDIESSLTLNNYENDKKKDDYNIIQKMADENNTCDKNIFNILKKIFEIFFVYTTDSESTRYKNMKPYLDLFGIGYGNKNDKDEIFIDLNYENIDLILRTE